MKKTLTILSLIAILIVALFLMTGCGDEETSSSKKKNKNDDKVSMVTNNDDNNDEKDSKSTKSDDKNDKTNDESDKKNISSDKTDSKKDTETKKTKSIDKTPIDLENSDSYYFIVKGVKYKAGDKISKLVENGFKQSKTGAEKEISASGYLIGGGAILNSEGKTVFDVTPVNVTKEKIKGADGQIGSFSIDQSDFEKLSGDVEIYGGITIGTSIEDIEAVFGKPSTKTDATEYAGPTYTYNAKARYRSFTFRFDKDGKLNSLRWQNYTFDK
ncbi:MAG: hypothetical protein K6B70_05785 [Clostridia bacterium]|nr:hypothetical protein [Clostridia bacterium]